MSLANFFDKTALAAADILQGFDREAFSNQLERNTIGVAFDERAAGTFEGRVTLDLTINLLARFYPRVGLISCGADAGKIRDELSKQALAINPQIDFARDSDAMSAVIAVGSTPAPAGVPVIYVGSRGWIMHMSPGEPVGCGDSNNPFGAAAAACFGAANIFRLLFSDQLPEGSGRLDGVRGLSLLDLEPDTPNPGDPLLAPVDLGDTSLVGNGAIGNAMVWVLARISGIVGRLNVVDPEVIELSNLQRYVLATQSDVDISKVALAEKSLRGSGILVQPFVGDWANYLEKREDWNLERVAVAVDSGSDRQRIQGSLPKWIANAWTQPGDLGVSRHRCFGKEACLTCLYFPEGPLKNEDQIVADAINLPGELMNVRNLLYTGAPVGRDFILRVAQASGVDSAELLRFENEPLRAFYSQAVCAGVMMKLGAVAPSAAGREVPMAFQSALAGILLASELVLHATQTQRAELAASTRINLLRPLGTDLSVPVAKKTRCICADPDYVTAYQKKWGR